MFCGTSLMRFASSDGLWVSADIREYKQLNPVNESAKTDVRLLETVFWEENLDIDELIPLTILPL